MHVCLTSAIMNITISIKSTTEASVTIDGREFRLTGKRVEGCSVWKYEQPLPQNTIGAIVANSLMSTLIDIMQYAIAVDDGNPGSRPWGTWEELPEELAEDIEMNID